MSAVLEPAAAEDRRAVPDDGRRPAKPLAAAEAFDLLPNALVVCDSRGRVIAANARLRAELGLTLARGASCCSLFGCGRAGTELEGACLTARALDCGAALPHVCVDSPVGPLRAAAAPLYGDRSRVVIELRPERRAAPSPPMLCVFALGRLRVESADGELTSGWLDQRPGQLLSYLACERHRVAPADAIAEAIWPQAGPAAGNSVRHFVHVLRERLEPDRQRRVQSSYVICSRGGYRLAPGRVWIDADQFDSDASAGLAACAAGDVRTAETSLARAARLYTGDFLSDEPYAEWALREREQLRAMACNVLRALADIRGDAPDAAGCLERLAEMEPFDTEVQRRLLVSWLREGRRSRAARHYETFRRRLMREFGEPPGFELAELATRVG